jgi:conserved hypothetical protein TIGR00427
MLELFKAIGLGLVVLLPLANPLTTVALFLGLAGNMNSAQRNQQALMASVYVFIIMMVAYYAGQLVMNTFGISIPGLRIAGGLIVAFIGFRMLFPQQKSHESPEAKTKSEELEEEPGTNIAFVPLAMPSTAGPGTIAMIISSASTIRHSSPFPDWVVLFAPPLVFAVVSVILWGSLRSSGAIMRLVGKGGIEAISRLMGFCWSAWVCNLSSTACWKSLPLSTEPPDGQREALEVMMLMLADCQHQHRCDPASRLSGHASGCIIPIGRIRRQSVPKDRV